MPVEVIDLSQIDHDLSTSIDDIKELYETSDVEEDEEEAVTYTKNEDILEDAVTGVEDSKRKFDHYVLDSDKTDFSGTLNGLATYRGRALNETRKQKLARLHRELAELQNDSDDDSETSDIEELRNLLQKISPEMTDKIGRIRRDLLTSSDGPPINEVELPDIKLNPQLLQKFENVESKLSALEKCVGSSTASKSVTTMINDLYREINMIKMDEESLTKFEQKMKHISEQYDKSIMGRRAQKEPKIQQDIDKKLKSFESKVDDIYDHYSILSKYSAIIPLLSERVTSLNHLHTSVNNMNSVVSDIDEHLTSVHSQIDKWEKAIHCANNQLSTREQEFQDTKRKIVTTLDDLEARVSRLDKN